MYIYDIAPYSSQLIRAVSSRVPAWPSDLPTFQPSDWMEETKQAGATDPNHSQMAPPCEEIRSISLLFGAWSLVRYLPSMIESSKTVFVSMTAMF